MATTASHDAGAHADSLHVALSSPVRGVCESTSYVGHRTCMLTIMHYPIPSLCPLPYAACACLADVLLKAQSSAPFRNIPYPRCPDVVGIVCEELHDVCRQL